METLGESGVLEYVKSGGKCVRQRCSNDAPRLRIGRTWLRMPCADHAAKQEAEWAEEDRAVRAALMLTGSGMTARLRPWSFETYARDLRDAEAKRALATAKAWAEGYIAQADEDRAAREDSRQPKRIASTPSLVMWGPVGCGKTGLAWSAVRAICEAGHQARLTNFAALLEAIKDCYARNVPTTHALGAHTVQVLALDDVGAERPTEWACGELLGIVDYRYEMGMPTLYVSNYDPAALRERLSRNDPVIGQRIVSRMLEGAETFVFEHGDRRQPA